jgi:putative flippase GtrA
MISILKKYKTQIKYLVFGVLTTLVDFVISFVLYKFINHHIANVIAWCGAVIFAYVVNKVFVFESKRSGMKAMAAELGAFVGSRVFSLILQEGIFVLAVDILTLDKGITKIAASVIVVITNYFLGKMIFAKKKGQK